MSKIKTNTLLDSGNRKQFSTGAKRDISDDKGRCDLMPLTVVARLVGSSTLDFVGQYMETGDVDFLENAIFWFSDFELNQNIYTTILENSIHFQEGAKKYGERNWEKGIPIHSYIDSAVRHYLKFRRGDTDERHDRAFVWNLLCAIWTIQNKKEMIDIVFEDE